MNDDGSWECLRCERVVACAFCECCALHCTSLRPNALEAHRRRGTIVVAPQPHAERSESAPAYRDAAW